MPSMQPTNWPMISGRSGIAEVQVVGDGERRGADRASGCARPRPPPARRRRTGIGAAVARRAVGGHAPAPCSCRGRGPRAASPPGPLHGVGHRPGGRTAPRSSACDARSGQPSRRAGSAVGGPGGGRRRGVDSGAAARRLARALVERRVVDQRRRPACRPRPAPCVLQHQAAGVGDAADDGEVQAPLVEDRARACSSRPGFSTISMRSWLSDSMIS